MSQNMRIVRQQHFNVDFFEFEVNSTKYRVGLGNYKNQDPGSEMFYPESGTDYMLVIFDNGWYKFDVFEFTHDASIYYIAEKLKCNQTDAKNIQVCHSLCFAPVRGAAQTAPTPASQVINVFDGRAIARRRIEIW